MLGRFLLAAAFSGICSICLVGIYNQQGANDAWLFVGLMLSGAAILIFAPWNGSGQ